MASSLNQSIGIVTVNAATTPHTVPANAGLKLNTSKYIATRHGNGSSTYSDIGTAFETASTFSASYYTRFDVLAQSGGTLSGTGQLSLVNASKAGNPVTLSITNGSATATLVCTIYDGTGANLLASFNVNLTADSTD